MLHKPYATAGGSGQVLCSESLGAVWACAPGIPVSACPAPRCQSLSVINMHTPPGPQPGLCSNAGVTLSGSPGGLGVPVPPHLCLSRSQPALPPRCLPPGKGLMPGGDPVLPGTARRTQEVGRGDVALPVRVSLLALPQELAPAALHPPPEPALDGLAVLQLWGAQHGARAAGCLWAERELSH